MSYHGDFALESTLDIKFTTLTFASGAPITLAGSPVVSAYPGNSTTQLTAGITLTVDFDGVTGLHNVRVVATAANGYLTATNYTLVLTAGTVGGTSVVGYVVGSFSIEARSALRPTVAARTLDVTATGAGAIDWGNVENPTTSNNLSGTQILTASAVETDTIDIQSRLPAALTADGNIKADTLRVGGTLQTAGDLAALIVTVDDLLDTEVAAIKAKTDQLTFSTANQLDARVFGFESQVIVNDAFATDTALRNHHSGSLQAATSTTATLAAGASAVDDYYNNSLLVVTSGTGSRQSRYILDYDGTTKVATVHRAFVTTPSSANYVVAPADLLPWNAAWDAEVESEVDDALVVRRLDELLNADSDIDGAAPPTVGSVFHELMTKTAGSFTYDQTTDSLEALRDRGDAAWITATSVSIASGGITTASFAAGAIDAAAIADNAIDAGAIASNAFTSTKFATGAITAATFAAGAINAAAIDTGAITLAKFAAGAIDATVIADGAIDAATFAAGAITAAVVATGAIDADALAADAVAEIWTTTLTESYRGAGAAGTAAQLLHEILQNITEFAISGTTKTVKKFDATTTAKTYTLDSSTAPTMITEAT